MLPNCNPPMPPEDLARWRRRFMLTAIGAAAMIIAAALIAKQFPLRSPARIALALVQGFGTAVVIIVSARGIGRLDELQQRIHLHALAIAFAGTGILGSAYGFLINAGLPDLDWGGILWPAMVGLWVVGLIVSNRRYR